MRGAFRTVSNTVALRGATVAQTVAGSHTLFSPIRWHPKTFFSPRNSNEAAAASTRLPATFGTTVQTTVVARKTTVP